MNLAAVNICRSLLSDTTRFASSFHRFRPLLIRLPPINRRTRQYSSHINVIKVLEERGLLNYLTDDSLRHSESSPLPVYCGFDPTADSLHLGNLVGLIVLCWFNRCGHRTVALVGGATGRIGDHSGKSLERPELDPASLDRNVAAISASIGSILERISLPSSSSIEILNNYDWWKDVTLLDFLTKVGRYARVMMVKGIVSVSCRELEHGISYNEFSYQLFQAYDFLHLFREGGVNVQIGGSDQWGNITAGTDLIRRILRTEGAYGLTFPLLQKGDGTKFGKSEDGAIWLSPSLLSPYQFYRYFFSIPDADVVRFLKILTFLSMDEISNIESEMKSSLPYYAQRILAEEVTRFIHGEEGLAEALATEALRSGDQTKLNFKTTESTTRFDTCFSSNRNVIEVLEERGLLKDLTGDSLRRSDSPPLRAYCGFDPTANSLHLGNLLGLIVLSWFIRCGHHAVALVGGATGRIGDPSGKSLERPELNHASLDRNVSAISASIRSILERVSSPSSFEILNNYDWWKDIKLINFLTEVGRYVRVGVMMSKESVHRRLKSELGIKLELENKSELGMNYSQFTYKLLQGYDFVHLFREEGIYVQVGGSDQSGNITAGTDLIRRILQIEGSYGLTFPLLHKSNDTKFGKSEDDAIWLSPSLLSPYQFYQYFFSISDTEVIKFLKILTFLSLDEICKIESEMQGGGYEPNSAQRRLAEEVTRFVHGEEGLAEALKATKALRPGTQTKLDSKTIESIAEDVPSYSLQQDQVLSLSLVDLSVCTGLLESKSAARRLLKQGGLYLNNNRIDCEAKKIELDDIVDGKVILLSAGKKNKMVVRIS